MKNFSLEKNVLFLGDKSRFVFAKTITGVLPSDYENCTLLLAHGNASSQIQSNGNFFSVASFKTPPGLKISLLKADDESWKKTFEKFSRIVLFEEFPLKKDSTQQLIDSWSNLPKSRPPLTIVIMDLAHHQGSTDLDNLDDAVLEAKKNYEAQGLDVVLFRSSVDVINILHRHESLIQKHKKILSGELQEIYDRMYELDFLYEGFVMDCKEEGGCLSLSAVNKVCSFNSIKTGNQNSFWEAYNAAALKKLFPSDTFAKGNLNDLLKIYAYILTGDFDGTTAADNWRVKKAKIELAQALQRNFLARMVGEKFSSRVYPYEVGDIVAYKKSTSDRSGRFYGINAEYSRQLKNFVEEGAKEILKSALNSYIFFFEKVIE